MLATYQLLSSSSMFWLIHHAYNVDCFCYQICINQKSVTLAYFLLTLLEYLRSSPVFSGGFVTRSLVLCVCFVFRCLSFCPFSLGHCVVCPFSMYGFWLPHLYLQTHLQIYCGSFFSFFLLFFKTKIILCYHLLTCTHSFQYIPFFNTYKHMFLDYHSTMLSVHRNNINIQACKETQTRTFTSK